MDTATKAETVKIQRLVHTIHAGRNIEAIRTRYMDLLGAVIFSEGYHEGEDRDMALLVVADYQIEIMTPRAPDREDKTFARFVQRFGESWHSFELRIDKSRERAAQLKAQGVRLTTESDSFFFVHPASTGGVVVEVTNSVFANDPYDRRNWNPGWAEGLPSTLLRVDHIACVTGDADAAVRFFTTLVDGVLVADERVETPQPGRRVVIRIANGLVAFTQPDDAKAGPLGAYLGGPRSGIYSMVWSVEDEAKAAAAFEGRKARITRDGCLSSGFAIDPRDFYGARHEFVQADKGLLARV